MTSSHFEKKLNKARHLQQLRNYPEALKMYAWLAKQFPAPDLWVEYGHAALVSGDTDLAERIWDKARTFEPNNVEIYLRVAAEYQKIGLHTKTRALYAEAAKIEPDNFGVQLGLASLLAETSSVD